MRSREKIMTTTKMMMMVKVGVIFTVIVLSESIDNVTAADCVSNDGTYRGKLNVSASGRPCFNWLSSKPCFSGIDDVNLTSTHNFCRNPVEPTECHHEKPFCYLDPSNSDWEFCDLPTCGFEPGISCLDPLGMGDGRIADDKIFAPTQYNGNFKASYARLNETNKSGWMANYNYPEYVYLSINLSKPYTVTKLAMTGLNSYVTKLKVAYSVDGFSWIFYGTNADDILKAREFEGNHDEKDLNIIYFDRPFQAILVALIPTTYGNLPALRIELYGCPSPNTIVKRTFIDHDINTNTYWSAVNSPYIIRSPLLLSLGATLSIEAGVKVVFADKSASLTVSGCLDLRSIEGLEVQFLSNNLLSYSASVDYFDSNKPFWQGVIFPSDLSTACNVNLRNLYVRGAGIKSSMKNVDWKGFIIKNSLLAISFTSSENVNLTNCLFNGNENGIELPRMKSANIESCQFNNHKNTAIRINTVGVSVAQFSLAISNSAFRNNNFGLYSQTYNYQSTTEIFQIANCSFVNHQSGGVQINPMYISEANYFLESTIFQSSGFYTSSSQAPFSWTLTNSVFTSYKQNQAAVFVGPNLKSLSVRNCTFKENARRSLFVETTADRLANVTIQQSKFTNNREAPCLQINLPDTSNIKSNFQIHSNVFSNNTMNEVISLKIPFQNDVMLSNNKLLDFNSQYEISCYGPYVRGFSYNADSNYWGSTDSRNIFDRVFDFYRDSSKSFVDVLTILKDESTGSLQTIPTRKFFTSNGTIGGLVDSDTILQLTAEYDAYNVTRNIYISNGSCLSIQGPLVLRFKPKTAIIVEGGCLRVEGKVTLTASDKTGNFDDYNWNGIKIFNSIGSIIRNVFVNETSLSVEVVNSSVNIQDSVFNVAKFLKVSGQNVKEIILKEVDVKCNSNCLDLRQAINISLSIIHSAVTCQAECIIFNNVDYLSFLVDSSLIKGSDNYYYYYKALDIRNVAKMSATVHNSSISNTIYIYYTGLDFTIENSNQASDKDCIVCTACTAIKFRARSNTFKCGQNVIYTDDYVSSTSKTFSITDNKILSGVIDISLTNPTLFDLSRNEMSTKLTANYKNLVYLYVSNVYNTFDVTRHGAVRIGNNIFKNVSGPADTSVLKLTCTSANGEIYNYNYAVYLRNNTFEWNDVTAALSTDCYGLTSDRNIFNNPISDYELKITKTVNNQNLQRPAYIYFARNYWGSASDPSFRVFDKSNDPNLVEAVINPWFESSDMTSLTTRTSTFEKGNGQIGGSLQEDVVLTFTKSPYTVIEDITIPAGRKLTVEPGVKINFLSGGIIVEGVLTMNGDDDNIVELVSKSNNSFWKGIKFQQKFTDWLIKRDKNWWSIFYKNAWYVVSLNEFYSKKVHADILCRQAGYKESLTQTVFDCNSLSNEDRLTVPPCTNNTGEYRRISLACPDANAFSLQECSLNVPQDPEVFYNITCLELVPTQADKYVKVTTKSGKRLAVTSSDDVTLTSQTLDDDDMFVQITPCLLATDPKCFSLMSSKKPGWFLRKNGESLILDLRNNPRRANEFNMDASFVLTSTFNPSDVGYSSIKVLSSSAPSDYVIFQENVTSSSSSSLSLVTSSAASASNSQSMSSFKMEEWTGKVSKRRKRSAGDQSILNNVRIVNPNVGISIQGKLPILKNIEVVNSASHSLQIKGIVSGNFTVENFISVDSGASGIVFTLADYSNDFRCLISNSTFVNTKEASVLWSGRGTLMVERSNFLQFNTFAINMESRGDETSVSRALIKSSQFKSKSCRNTLRFYGTGYQQYSQYFYVSIENNDFLELNENNFDYTLIYTANLISNIKSNRIVNCRCNFIISVDFQTNISDNIFADNTARTIINSESIHSTIKDNIFSNNLKPYGETQTIKLYTHAESKISVYNNSFLKSNLDYDIYIQSSWERLSGNPSIIYDVSNNKWSQNNWSDILKRISCFYTYSYYHPVNIWPSITLNDGNESIISKPLTGLLNRESDFLGGEVTYSRVLSNMTNGVYTPRFSIFVPANVTLTLNGGIVLEFAKDLSFAVEGYLVINATAEFPVTFKNVHSFSVFGDEVKLRYVRFVNIKSFAIIKANKISVANVQVEVMSNEFRFAGDVVEVLNSTFTQISSYAVNFIRGDNLNKIVENKLTISGCTFIGYQNGLRISRGFDVVEVNSCSISKSYYVGLSIENSQYRTNSTVRIINCLFADNGLSVFFPGYVMGNTEISRSSFTETPAAPPRYTGYQASCILLTLDNGDEFLLQENTFQKNSLPSVKLLRAFTGSTKKLTLKILDNVFVNSSEVSLVLENLLGVEASILRNKFHSNMADRTKSVNKASFSYIYTNDYALQYNSWPPVQSTISQNRFEKNGGKFCFELMATFDNSEQILANMYNKTNSQLEISSNVFLDNFPLEGVVLSNIPSPNFTYNIFSNPFIKYDFVSNFKTGFTQNCTYNWWGSNESSSIAGRLKDATTDATLGRIVYEPYLNETKFSCSGVQSCSGNGLCVAPDVCQCYSGWTGPNCGKYSCSRVYDCLGRGACVGPDRCNCEAGWWGDDCSRTNCYQRNNCSNRGVCIGPDQCMCASQYSGLDCSQCKEGWWGSSCLPCPSCVHGTCNKNTGTCDCIGPNFGGPLCDQCAPKFFGATCLPLVKLFSINPDYGPDLGGTVIYVSGNNLPNVTTYKCRFGGDVEVNASWISADKISCISPRTQANVVSLDVKINDAQGYLNNKFFFTFNPACPTSACGSTITPRRGMCNMGLCTCFVPWTGSDCDQLGLAPEISAVKNVVLMEGQDFTLQLNTTQGTPSLRWLLLIAPNGINLDESSGLITWAKVPASTKAYNLKVECSNKYGRSLATFDVAVPPSYALVLDALPRGPFIRPQSTLISGRVAWVDGMVNPYLTDSQLPLVLLIKSNFGLRKISLTSTPMSQRGLFYTRFQPLSSEIGLTELDARHPSDVGAVLTNVQQSWRVYGLNFAVSPSTVSEYVGQYSYRNFLVVSNNGLDPLTNLIIMMNTPPFDLTLYSNVSAQVTCEWSSASASRTTNCSIANTLKVNETIHLDANIIAEAGYSGSLPIALLTREGVVDEEIVTFSYQQKYPAFVFSRDYVEAIVSRGKIQFEQIQLTNVGARAATNVKPQLPSSSLLSFISFGSNTTTLTSTSETGIILEPGQTCTLVFSFNPSANESIGDLQGSASVVSTETAATFRFRFIIASTDHLNLTIRVEDEYTYFSNEKPLLAGAKISLTSRYTGLTLQQITNNSGVVTFVNIPEDYYTLQTSAEKHLPDSRVIFATQGQNLLSVFLQRTAVTYSWVVKPVVIEDRYDIVLEADFTTNVPIPVVTMEPTQFDLDLMERGILTSLQMKITNHGLIAARGFQFKLPPANAHPFLTLSMSNTDLGDIPANTTLYAVVEVHVDEIKKLQYLDSSLAKRSVRKRSNIIKCLSMLLESIYWYLCDKKRYNELMTTIDNSKVCHADVPSGGIRGGVFRPWLAPAFGWGSGSDLSRGTTVTSPINCKCVFKYPWTCFKAYRSVTSCIKVFGEIAKTGVVTAMIKCMEKLEAVIECAQLFLECQFGIGGSEGGGGGSGGSPSRKKRDAVLSKEDMGLMMGERAIAVYEYYVLAKTYLGGDDWFYLLERPSQWFSEVFDPIFSDTSDGGSLVTKNEFDGIMNSPLPSNATQEMVRRLVLRYNSSFADWSRGGEGLADGMIRLAKVQESEQKLKVYEDKAKKDSKKSIADWYLDAFNIYQQAESSPDEGVCAKVRIQILQRMTLTRTGFEAELRLENGEASDLTGIKVVIEITTYGTTNTTDAFFKFAIGKPTVEGLTDVTGSGVLKKGNTGTARWLIIPYSSAAPTSDVQYNVGGTLYYTVGNQSMTVPLFPDTITVKPDPRLHVNYFLEKYVYSDDPFTQNVVEPAVPFILGILITNLGYGPATNLKITSSQPKIIDNEKGLLVDFKIVGTKVAAGDVSPSLTVNFGDILPMSTMSAQWMMTCSLSGTFSNYSATFQNTNPLGDSRLSLLEEVNFHELLHTVLIDFPKSDSLVDFLIVDPSMTLDLLPYLVYDSSNATNPLNVSMCNVSSDGLLLDRPLKLTVACETFGWVYVRTLFPSAVNLLQTFTSVTRNNSKQIDVERNIWLQQIKQENYLHIFDYIPSPGTFAYSIIMKAANLHPPKFSSDAISVDVPENIQPPHVVVTVNATDADGEDNVVTYSLRSQPDLPFKIEPQNGVLSTTRQLDREERDQYSIVVIATDSGNPAKTGTLIVAVNVTDVNDNAPQILGLPGTLSFEDITAVGSELLKNVAVKDVDAGDNSVLTVQLVHPDNHDLLAYNQVDQTITSKTSFAGHLGSHEFIINATDHGLPPLTTTAKFILKISKANKFKPTFNNTEYVFNVSETKQAGTVVGKLSAWDGDDPDEKITYSVVPSSEYVPFTLNSNTGVVTNLMPMVASSENTIFKFKVMVADDGAPPTGQLSSSVDVLVRVVDVNDHWPMFSQPSYVVKVPENASIDTELLVAQVSDLDFGINSEIKDFSFKILSPHNLVSGNYFKLVPDLQSKRVKLLNTASFDRELIDTFVLELKAVDSGAPPLESTATVAVSVTDVNDCIPRFNSTSANITVLRRTPVNFLLYTFKAEDCDLDSQLVYTTVSSLPDVFQFISVNRDSGVVRLIAPLGNNLTLKLLQVSVQASDGRHVSLNTQDLTIHITDINLYPPVFKQQIYETSLKETLEVGSTLNVDISCTDQDSSALYYYFQAGNEENFFAINLLSGQLSLAKPLDYETKSLYSLTVVAFDDMERSTALNSTAVVRVNVQNANEYPPNFVDKSGLTLKLTAGQLAPKFYQFIAKDDDNDDVTMSILPSLESGYFSLEPTTGWLSVVKPVSQASEMMIQIEATDNGNPPLSAILDVVVAITDAKTATAATSTAATSTAATTSAILTTTSTTTARKTPNNSASRNTAFDSMLAISFLLMEIFTLYCNKLL